MLMHSTHKHTHTHTNTHTRLEGKERGEERNRGSARLSKGISFLDWKREREKEKERVCVCVCACVLTNVNRGRVSRGEIERERRRVFTSCSSCRSHRRRSPFFPKQLIEMAQQFPASEEGGRTRAFVRGRESTVLQIEGRRGTLTSREGECLFLCLFCLPLSSPLSFASQSAVSRSFPMHHCATFAMRACSKWPRPEATGQFAPLPRPTDCRLFFLPLHHALLQLAALALDLNVGGGGQQPAPGHRGRPQVR